MIEKISAIVGLIGVAFGAYFFVDSRYALAEELKHTKETSETRIHSLERRLEIKIKGDAIRQIQERVWKLEDRQVNNPADESLKSEIRLLSTEKEALSKELDLMKQADLGEQQP